MPRRSPRGPDRRGACVARSTGWMRVRARSKRNAPSSPASSSSSTPSEGCFPPATGLAPTAITSSFAARMRRRSPVCVRGWRRSSAISSCSKRRRSRRVSAQPRSWCMRLTRRGWSACSRRPGSTNCRCPPVTRAGPSARWRPNWPSGGRVSIGNWRGWPFGGGKSWAPPRRSFSAHGRRWKIACSRWPPGNGQPRRRAASSSRVGCPRRASGASAGSCGIGSVRAW